MSILTERWFLSAGEVVSRPLEELIKDVQGGCVYIFAVSNQEEKDALKAYGLLNGVKLTVRIAASRFPPSCETVQDYKRSAITRGVFVFTVVPESIWRPVHLEPIWKL